ncbi:F-box protein PP2-B15 [Raphanus sativus]|uniref:F-box protein PP2-B15 n=1 Tax=Raphanus sativus TaxID=3726 RepID=A0A6J0KU62_RAPSA|nr:F-box protein PP2-B15 [Raphanus sativus]KAJ4867660.1 F-box protein PP2-B15 [Raphanus sativus]
MNMLPEACVANILSFTTPADTFSSAAVSSVFSVAADSDFVWEKFLPSGYSHLISTSTTRRRKFSSKKELYRRLCESILIDNGRKIFKIDRLSGKITYVLSARDLSITWSDQRHYWFWSRRADSRFSEAVQLMVTNWLEIKGKIQTGALSPNTSYEAYLIMKVTERAYGLELVPAETWVKVGNGKKQIKSSYLSRLSNKKQQMERLFYGHRVAKKDEAFGSRRREPRVRDDGWMEIEIGEFETGREGGGDDDKEVVMSLTEVIGYQLKGGIVIDGIEVRPKPSKVSAEYFGLS